MAGMLPIAVLILLGVAALVVGTGFAIFSMERRYQQIIRKLENTQDTYPSHQP